MTRRIYVTDCEGPLTRNDNAQEIAERFLPDGAEFFARLSKYDDFLVDRLLRDYGLDRRLLGRLALLGLLLGHVALLGGGHRAAASASGAIR